MNYKILISTEAKNNIKKIDRHIALKILHKFEDDLSKFGNPRAFGKALKGNLCCLWRYRIGDYRIICDIQDNILTIVLVRIAHRKNVYD